MTGVFQALLGLVLVLNSTASSLPACEQILSRAQHEMSNLSSSTLGQQFNTVAYAGLLLQQMDERLAQRRLILPNGGLCATTCAVNILHAISRYIRGHGDEFVAMPDYQIQQMVNLAWSRHGRDARVGLDLDTLMMIMKDVAASSGLPMNIRSFHSNRSHVSSIDDFALQDDELILAGVESGLDVRGVRTYHAIVISKVDTHFGTVTYSDPNFPNQVQKVSADIRPGAFGQPTLKINLGVPRPTAMTGAAESWLRIRARSL